MMAGEIHPSLSAWRKESVSLLNHISDAASLEAELLIEHVTGLSRTRQHVDGNTTLTHDQWQQLNTLRKRRISGEPLAYILGEAHFWTLKLKVAPGVLIPRPETELVVERALFHLSQKQMNVLDLGTGSGAIALAIATERSHCKVLACDVAEDALAVARENRNVLQLANVELRISDWFSAISDQRFDVIVSNPPYIDNDDAHVQTEVRTHEPHLALFAEDNGLQALRTIIHRAPQHLNHGGWLILEHGWQQAEKVRELLELQGLRSVASHTDLSGHQRVTEARFSSS